MQITSINYQKTFNIGSYQSLKLGAEMSIEKGEDAEAGMETLRSFVHEYFTKHAPTEAFEQTGEQVRDIGEPIDKRTQAIIQDIQSCTAIDEKNSLGVQVGLLSYEDMAYVFPDIRAVYEHKMIELSKK